MEELVSRNESKAAAGLRALFGKLWLGYVENFGDSQSGKGFQPVGVVGWNQKANVVTSQHLGTGKIMLSERKHALLLDIDHPAWLVKSSTEGHFHLYIDVPGGIRHDDYMRLLGSLADCGVIEHGYAGASQRRGHTSLRLPWVKKGGV